MNKGISIGIIALFIVSAVSPMVIGFKSDAVKDVKIAEIAEAESTITSGPMDSPWPMYCQNIRHTGQSPYCTANTSGWEIWKFKLSGPSLRSAPVLDSDGIIYVGRGDLYAIYPNGTLKWKFDYPHSSDSAPAIDDNGIIYIGTKYCHPKDHLYAIYANNGTLKWKYPTDNMLSSPAIGDDGTIYFCESNYWKITALHSNGTLKWQYKTGHVIYSSPAIGLDGTIYCGSHDGCLHAIYPNNGTLKWKYSCGQWVHGSPTIGDDGTVYIGMGDQYLYAFYPNNGTVKWKLKIGNVGGSPAIDNDGIIYVGTFQMRFFAIYPNGTIKWRYEAPGRVWFGNSAAISADGTIYFRTTDMDGGLGTFIALNPDGSERWKVENGLYETSPAIAKDGTIYACSSHLDYGYLRAFGAGGEVIAYANGPYYGLIDEYVEFLGDVELGYPPYTWQWDFGDGNFSSEQNPKYIYSNPGNYTVILTITDNSSNQSSDTTWAWIQESNDPPSKPSIEGKINGTIRTKYDYTFISSDPEGLHIWYYIDWGDGKESDWLGPYESGDEIIRRHQWDEKGTFIIRCKTKDIYGAESEWATLEVTMPKTKPSNFNFPLISWWLERFPILQKILDVLRLNI